MPFIDSLPASAPAPALQPDSPIPVKSPPNKSLAADILDIRCDHQEQSLYDAIHQGLHCDNGSERRLPTSLLYDESGLKLFEKITYLDEYYLTNAEIEVLETSADQIAQALSPGSIVLELGSGNLRKVSILLDAIERLGKVVDYYALDLSLSELERTLAEVSEGRYKHVHFHGLHGTYDDGLEWLKGPEVQAKTKTILWLGSSIGNFSRRDAAHFLKTFTNVLDATDSMLIGVDACKEAARVYNAYNDHEGITHEFYRNGLLNANRILGEKVFELDNWEVAGEYNTAEGRHEAYITPRSNINTGCVSIRKGEKIRLEEAYKYDAAETHNLWQLSSATETVKWSNKRKDYGLHLIMPNKFGFPLNPENYAAQPVPTWEQWTELWVVWDAVTRRMLPDEELLEKPIKLRNACIFYLGHIPTFFDMKLAITIDGKLTPPEYYSKIFERGIDPDVDNPEQCHAHSDIPDEWPPVDDILAFQGRVRERVRRLYKSGEALNPKVGRVLWLGYEHEAMHLETLLYMLIQSEKTLPPPGTVAPDFELLAKQAGAQSITNEWFTIPESQVDIGLDDPENDLGPSRHFGWDIEKPARKIKVSSFQAQARPISVEEYAKYLRETGQSKVPSSWVAKEASDIHTNGHSKDYTNGHISGEISGESIMNKFVNTYSIRTVYGPVSLKYVLSWPVSASYDELAGCAAWMGGRIPTLEETRSMYRFADQYVKDQAVEAIGSTIPAVNGHLVNDGVEESPTITKEANGAGNAGTNRINREDAQSVAVDPHNLFVNLSDCNVGFQCWHPTSVTQKGDRLSGQADFGGLWEWTSTPLSRHNGYAEMPLYPAYSSDFFDGKHNIVLGGSWATVPRIAGRKSFINWYQRNYPYAWAGARVVKDL